MGMTQCVMLMGKSCELYYTLKIFVKSLHTELFPKYHICISHSLDIKIFFKILEDLPHGGRGLYTYTANNIAADVLESEGATASIVLLTQFARKLSREAHGVIKSQYLRQNVMST